MGEPVIVTTGGDDSTDTATAFAAGVATVVASEAAATADEAAAAATTALGVAEGAASTAYATQDELGALRDDVRALGDRFMETLGAVVELLNEEGGQGDDGTSPEVVVQTGDGTIDTKEGDPDKQTTSGPAKKTRRNGQAKTEHWWFGNRG